MGMQRVCLHFHLQCQQEIDRPDPMQKIGAVENGITYLQAA